MSLFAYSISQNPGVGLRRKGGYPLSLHRIAYEVKLKYVALKSTHVPHESGEQDGLKGNGK